MKKRYRYNLIQDNIVVASVDALSEAQALQEINHYAVMYSQDRPVKIVKIKTK